MINSGFDANAGLNPLSKSVVTGNPGWLANYTTYPLSQLARLGGILGALLALAAASGQRAGLAIIGTLCTAAFALFPFIMPSSIDAASSLTVLLGYAVLYLAQRG